MKRYLFARFSALPAIFAAAVVCTQPVRGEDLAVAYSQIASGFNAPTQVTSMRDGSNRLFIAEHSGTVQELSPTGEVRLFLDITNRVFERDGFCCNEQGLLGIAFPPEGKPKDHFFISYVDRDSNVVVSRFEISPETGVGDPASEKRLQVVPHPDVNHYGGKIVFHPTDGLLYWSIGDGSAGFNVIFAQDTFSPYGKILRFDAYAEQVPANLEIYARGLRNPWRFSIDSATGDMYIGDVGENTFEELNYIPGGTEAGKMNFGWGIMEGHFCYEFGECKTEGLDLPIFAFDHETGCSSTDGETYRGANPAWQGKHFFADFCRGTIWYTKRMDDGTWMTTEAIYWPDVAVSSFGTGDDGEIYFVGYVFGGVYKLELNAAPMGETAPGSDEAARGPRKGRRASSKKQ
ncbi:glucose dehydrogenase [Bryobacterales bacterium F-183]|nr:glucose dehydrogenase [Bryobacterales bacterium F-183]